MQVSVGTYHPKNMGGGGGLTCELVPRKVQHPQTLEVPQGLGDGSLIKGGTKKSPIGPWSYGTDHEKWKKMTFEFIEVQIQYLQVFQISEGLRDAPYRERGQKKQRNSDGQWGLTAPKTAKNHHL
jgi:hypothetical protein